MHVRCPHCHNAIEVVEEASLNDIECPSCGSSFGLLGERETVSTGDDRGTIGHFELFDIVGRGAFGKVWRARDHQLDRQVAVKIPRKGQLGPEETEWFLREARAAAQLKHPNIVPVYEVGREDDTVYIVSDFVDGYTLADRLTSGPVGIRESVELCQTVSDALHHAHEHGVIHRDLKPGNIMLDNSGQPHVMDFGLAKRDAGEITMTIEGKVLGTPAYMAPEQAEGRAHEVDRRADIYSMGVILFELMTGELPFRGNQRMLLHQVIHDNPPSPRKLNSHIPRDLETICLKCLSKGPARRYENARELADDLARYANGQPIMARPVSRLEKAWLWCRRKPIAAALILVLLIISIVAPIVATRQQLLVNELKRTRGEREQAIASLTFPLSFSLWMDGNTEEAQRLLGACPTHFRGWVFEFLQSLFQRAPQVLYSHDGSVCDVALLGNNQIVSADYDGLVQIYDGATGQLKNSLMEPTGLGAMALSPSKDTLAILALDGKVKLKSLPELEDLRAEIPAFASVNEEHVDCRFSRDGRWFAGIGFDDSKDCVLKVWSTNDWSVVGEMAVEEEDWLSGLCFSQDGQTVFAGADSGYVYRWEFTGNEVLRSSNNSRDEITCIEISSDGKLLATGCHDSQIIIWHPETLELESQMAGPGHDDTVWSVAFDASDRILVSGGADRRLIAWDIATKLPVNTIRGNTSAIVSMAIDKTGETVFFGSRGSNVKRCRILVEQIWTTLSFEDLIFSADIDNQCSIVAGSCQGGPLKYWDGTSRQFILLHDDSQHPAGEADKLETDTRYESGDWVSINDIAVSQNGDRIVAATDDSRIFIWNTRHPDRPTTFSTNHNSMCVALSPDGHTIAGGGDDDNPSICLWDSSGQLLYEIDEHDDQINAIQFSPDSRLVATAGEDGIIGIWDVESGQLNHLFDGHSGSVDSVAFSPDGFFLASGGDEYEIFIWNLQDGTNAPLNTSCEINFCVAWSPDSSIIASGGSDQSVTIWNTQSQNQLLRVKAHEDYVYSVQFTSDGNTLMSASRDGTVKLWQVD